MIDREPLMREAPQRQRHQIAVVGSLTGRPGPLRAIRRLALCGKPTHPRPSGAGIWGIPVQLAENPVPFLKLHGCLDHVHDAQIPPILTPEHYAHHADHRRRLFDRLNDWAHESPMIFCGYRLGDAHIRSLIDRLTPGTRPTFYLAVKDADEWNVYCGALESLNPKEFTVGRLSRREIENLLDLLSKYDSLGALEDRSREQQVRYFHDHADRQLLVALHEATRGKPFEEIVLTEYEAVVPESARQLYLDICTLNQFAVPARAGTISRISGIRFRDYEAHFFKPLEALIYCAQDAISGDYHYKARHSHVAEMVFRQACTSDTENRIK